MFKNFVIIFIEGKTSFIPNFIILYSHYLPISGFLPDGCDTGLQIHWSPSGTWPLSKSQSRLHSQPQLVWFRTLMILSFPFKGSCTLTSINSVVDGMQGLRSGLMSSQVPEQRCSNTWYGLKPSVWSPTTTGLGLHDWSWSCIAKAWTKVIELKYYN